MPSVLVVVVVVVVVVFFVSSSSLLSFFFALIFWFLFIIFFSFFCRFFSFFFALVSDDDSGYMTPLVFTISFYRKYVVCWIEKKIIIDIISKYNDNKHNKNIILITIQNDAVMLDEYSSKIILFPLYFVLYSLFHRDHYYNRIIIIIIVVMTMTHPSSYKLLLTLTINCPIIKWNFGWNLTPFFFHLFWNASLCLILLVRFTMNEKNLFLLLLLLVEFVLLLLLLLLLLLVLSFCESFLDDDDDDDAVSLLVALWRRVVVKVDDDAVIVGVSLYYCIVSKRRSNEWELKMCFYVQCVFMFNVFVYSFCKLQNNIIRYVYWKLDCKVQKQKQKLKLSEPIQGTRVVSI